MASKVRGRARPSARLAFDREVYNPHTLQTAVDQRELRREYSRLRSIARKRLERFEGTEWMDSQSYRMNKGKYKPLKDIGSVSELAHLTSDLARFITAETSTVAGLRVQRERSIETLRQHGYEFVNEENYKQFYQFMEYARSLNMGRMYDSKRVVEEVFNPLAEKGRKIGAKELQKAFNKFLRDQSRGNFEDRKRKWKEAVEKRQKKQRESVFKAKSKSKKQKRKKG